MDIKVFGYTINELRLLNDNAWLYYSYVVFLIPLTAIMIYKFIFPINYNELTNHKIPFKRHKIDVILQYICFYAVFYYAIDVLIKFGTGRVFSKCGASYTYHHLVSIYYLPLAYKIRYWPWFWLGPPALHSYLLIWPEETWLNYIYLTSIINFQVSLYQKPWTNLKEYSVAKLGIILLEVACVLLWFFGCKNTICEIPGEC